MGRGWLGRYAVLYRIPRGNAASLAANWKVAWAYYLWSWNYLLLRFTSVTVQNLGNGRNRFVIFGPIPRKKTSENWLQFPEYEIGGEIGRWP